MNFLSIMQIQSRYVKEIPIHFIIGIGRSGTSLLTSVLNAHPNTLACPEVLFISFFYSKFKNKKSWKDQEVEQILEYLDLFAIDHPYIGWNYEKEKLRATLRNLPTGTDYLTLCKTVCLHFEVDGKSMEDIQLLVDKNPANTLCWGELLRLSPESKFIIALRDYRGNVLSRKQSIHTRTPNTAINAFRWKFFNEKAFELLKKHPEKVLLVKYEELAKNPEEQVKKMCKFFNIEYLSEMLDFHQREHDVLHEAGFSGSEHKIKRAEKKYGDLASPINSERVMAWENELHEKDVKWAEFICRVTGKKFGYEPSSILPITKKAALFFKSILPFFVAWWDVSKTRILLHFPPETKLSRLRAIYKK